MIRAHPEPLHHAAAHHAPAQGAHHFPEFHSAWVGLAAARLVAREQLLARAKAADRLVDLAETPGVDANPAQILHGIAEMRELPVQHRAHAVGPDDEIAMTEIAMHQRYFARRPGIVISEPAQRQLEDRSRPAKPVILTAHLG